MRYILIVLLMTLSTPALACSCRNPEAIGLYEKSDIVVVASVLKEVKNDKQRVSVKTLIKGSVPQAGLFVNVPESVCHHYKTPLLQDRDYLLFMSKTSGGYELNATCYQHTGNKGLFDFRAGESFVNIHQNMLTSFFKAKGKAPKLELYVSANAKGEKIVNWFSIKNLGDNDVEILHPASRQAYTVFALDDRGNIVPPTGYAKVDPAAHAPVKLSAGNSFNYKIEPASHLYFPYLSGTAQFGYALDKGKKYRVHVVYRPFGGTYGSVSSAETEFSVY